jgi:hypothetical protein
MVELKINVAEEVIHQYGKLKVEKYLENMIQRLNFKSIQDLNGQEEESPNQMDLTPFITDSEIQNYIIEHDLTENLKAALSRINDFFDHPIIKFEHTIDIEEGFESFFVYIITDLSTKEASLQIRQMFKGWELLKNRAFTQKIAIITRRADAI